MSPGDEGEGRDGRARILETLRGPLPFLGLMVIVIEGVMGVAIARGESSTERITYVVLAVSLFVFAGLLLAFKPDSFLSGRQQLEKRRIENEREMILMQATNAPAPFASPA